MPSALGRSRDCKIVGWRLLLLGVAILILMGGVSLSSAQLPPSAGAPSVGQKAPTFTLPDQQGNMVSLQGLLKSTGTGKVKGLVLIYYRGYW